MAKAANNAFLDRPAARALAALVFVAAAGFLTYYERDRLFGSGPADAAAAADDPFVQCFAERAAQIDQMVTDKVVSADQAAQFKGRAEAMCRAQTKGAGGPPGGAGGRGACALLASARAGNPGFSLLGRYPASGSLDPRNKCGGDGERLKGMKLGEGRSAPGRPMLRDAR
mgnify:CR=1 FL=1